MLIIIRQPIGRRGCPCSTLPKPTAPPGPGDDRHGADLPLKRRMHRREKVRRFDSELVACVEKIEVREEGPAEEIRKEARDGACDLIVMGTHGKGALEATFMGSVARRVIRRAKRPVLVVSLPRSAKKTALRKAFGPASGPLKGR